MVSQIIGFSRPNCGTLSKMTYGNGMVVRNQYDEFNCATGVYYNICDQTSVVVYIGNVV